MCCWALFHYLGFEGNVFVKEIIPRCFSRNSIIIKGQEMMIDDHEELQESLLLRSEIIVVLLKFHLFVRLFISLLIEFGNLTLSSDKIFRKKFHA